MKKNQKLFGDEEKQTEKKNDFDLFSGRLLFFMHPEMFANLSENG